MSGFTPILPPGIITVTSSGSEYGGAAAVLGFIIAAVIVYFQDKYGYTSESEVIVDPRALNNLRPNKTVRIAVALKRLIYPGRRWVGLVLRAKKSVFLGNEWEIVEKVPLRSYKAALRWVAEAHQQPKKVKEVPLDLKLFLWREFDA